MKLEKNKIIFIAAIVLVIILMVGYYAMVVADSEHPEREVRQPTVPELKDGQKEYSSKLEAVNDVQKKRETNAPSLYSETYIDSTGLYDPDLEEKRRQHIVDSIYSHGRIDYTNNTLRNPNPGIDAIEPKRTRAEKSKRLQAETVDFSEAHAEFFSSAPNMELPNTMVETQNTDAFIVVEVNGEQTVRTDGRLELRLAVDALIEGRNVPRNTLMYGFVNFKANRVLLNITNIEHRPVDLRAFDLLDGNEGIYIENSFRSEASREVLDDVVQDINIAGVPQIGGIKQVFRRNNRNVKVTIYNQYQLLLKAH